MLVGTASPSDLATHRPMIKNYLKDEVALHDVTCFQLVVEMRGSAREQMLPPALHPTIPAVLSINVWRVGQSSWGPFQFAFARVSCRSGVRARGFTTGAYGNEPAANSVLADHFGFPVQEGHVQLRHSYDGVDVQVQGAGDEMVLLASGLDPEPMAPNDVQYVGSLNLAQTSIGLRLVQVETHQTCTQVERLNGHLEYFDAEAWGEPLLTPYHVVSATVALQEVTLPAVRFVCKADELAFTGTEAV